ncbi:hypothetical protein LQZ18_00405 [Lachnospiraceae bacterium ZAX-1]
MRAFGITAKNVQDSTAFQMKALKASAKTTGANQASTKGGTAYDVSTPERGVSLILSEQGKVLSKNPISEPEEVPLETKVQPNADDEGLKDGKVDKANDLQMYRDMLEQSNQAAEGAAEGYDNMAKALEIARRLMHGDRVPAKDEKLLMEYSGELYMKAKMIGSVAKNDDPKDYDSLVEDETKKAPKGSEAGTLEASLAEAVGKTDGATEAVSAPVD